MDGRVYIICHLDGEGLENRSGWEGLEKLGVDERVYKICHLDGRVYKMLYLDVRVYKIWGCMEGFTI